MEVDTSSESECCNLSSGVIINHAYEIGERIGGGAFSTVYKANSLLTNKPVAIKTYSYDPHDIEYFQNELNILLFIKSIPGEDNHLIVQHVDHFATMLLLENVVKIHPCLVTEYINGSLRDLMSLDDEFNGFPLVVSKKITRQLLTAVNLLHTHNIVIADLKTDNIMVRAVEWGVPKIALIDFNHSFMVGDKHSRHIGTQIYSSPEIVLGMHVDTPTDIWSVGCVLYEIFTGFELFAIDDDSSESCATSVGMSRREDSCSESSEYHFSINENYEYLKLIFQLLGKPPVRFIKDGNDYYNSKGNLRFNPEVSRVNIIDYLAPRFSYDVARDISIVMFKMLRYRPEERKTACELMKDGFFSEHPLRRKYKRRITKK